MTAKPPPVPPRRFRFTRDQYYGRIETVIEIDKRVVRPETLPELFARYYFAALLQKQGQDPERLILQLDLPPLFTKFVGPKIDLVNSKAHSFGRSQSLQVIPQDKRLWSIRPLGQRLQRSSQVTSANKSFVFIGSACYRHVLSM